MNLFITGTGTGVGKTQVCATWAREAIQRGQAVCYYKLIETGVEKGPLDEMEVRRGRHSPHLITKTLSTFKKPASPHFAAALEGRAIDFAELISQANRLPRGELTLWEGAGGALVPIDEKHFIIDLAPPLGAEVVIVSPAGLGAINQVLMTVECVEKRGLKVAKVVLNLGVVREADPAIVANNRETIQARTGIEVEILERESVK